MATILGDCLEVLKTMESNSVDSIVTDPPYELNFMGKEWDGTGIANNVELWKEALRVLKHGGHLLAFGGTRTYHRMTCAIEDAGFEIRDCIEWIYGTGFPKSNNIGKSIDKMKDAKREVVGKHTQSKQKRKEDTSIPPLKSFAWEYDITAPSSLEAKQWDGWGTGLKPAHEPIVMARKPIEESTIAKNVLKYGTGGINIDGCRVGNGNDYTVHNDGSSGSSTLNWNKEDKKESSKIYKTTTGRFPANLILDDSEVVRSQFPNSKSIKSNRGGNKTTTKTNSIKFGSSELSNYKCGYNDNGFAARFFYCAKVSKAERNLGCEELEEKKQNDYSSSSDGFSSVNPQRAYNKNNHPTVKPQSLLKYLITLITPPKGIVLDIFMGSGSTGVAAYNLGFEFIGIEKEEDYYIISNKRINATNKQPNLFED